MPDYRPLPMKDPVNPQPMHPASAKMSEWMNSYMPTVMSKINAGSVGPTNMGMGNQNGGGISDMLFKAIHPDTFAKVLDFLKPSTPDKSIPSYDDGIERVPQTGLAQVKEGEAVIPANQNPANAYGTIDGQRFIPGSSGYGHPLRSQGGAGPVINPTLSPGDMPRWGEKRGAYGEVPMSFGGTPAPLGTGQTGSADFALGQPDFALGHTPFGQTGPAPIEEGGENRYRIGEGPWQRLQETPIGPTGIESMAGYRGPTSEGLELAARNRWEAPGYAQAHPLTSPGYQRSYYDAHPEEKAAQDVYDMTRGPAPDSYEAGVERFRESNLMDIAKNRYTTGAAKGAAMRELRGMQTNRDAAGFAAGTYGKAMEHGPGTPGSQEKLAHAKYLSEMPAAHLEGISLQNQTHLEGIQREVEGHLGAAKIAAEVKDPIIKEIGALMVQGQKEAALYGHPFDPQKIAAPILKMYHALGKISDKEWKMLPKEYTEETKVERRLPGETVAAYLKRTKQ